MILAGLDIATKSGWAVMKDGVITTTTYYGKSRKKLEGEKVLRADNEGSITRHFQDALRTWLITNKVDYVAIEAPLVTSGEKNERVVDSGAAYGKAITYIKKARTNQSAIVRLGALAVAAAAECDRLSIPCVFVHQATWRKAFIGHGGRGKSDYWKREAVKMCRMMRIDISSEDAAEAAGIVYWLNLDLNPYSRAAAAANSIFNLPR